MSAAPGAPPAVKCAPPAVTRAPPRLSPLHAPRASPRPRHCMLAAAARAVWSTCEAHVTRIMEHGIPISESELTPCGAPVTGQVTCPLPQRPDRRLLVAAAAAAAQSGAGSRDCGGPADGRASVATDGRAGPPSCGGPAAQCPPPAALAATGGKCAARTRDLRGCDAQAVADPVRSLRGRDERRDVHFTGQRVRVLTAQCQVSFPFPAAAASNYSPQNVPSLYSTVRGFGAFDGMHRRRHTVASLATLYLAERSALPLHDRPTPADAHPIQLRFFQKFYALKVQTTPAMTYSHAAPDIRIFCCEPP